MPISDTLKNDIRVRERLLRKNQLTQSEIDRQDSALLDVEENSIALELKQPALQKESERAIDGPRISRPAPAARPAPIRPFEDEDDGVVPDPKSKLKPVVEAAAAAIEDDEDEDDEDEDEDDDDEDEAEGEGEEKPKPEGEKA